jgi:hypothetical protein
MTETTFPAGLRKAFWLSLAVHALILSGVGAPHLFPRVRHVLAGNPGISVRLPAQFVGKEPSAQATRSHAPSEWARHFRDATAASRIGANPLAAANDSNLTAEPAPTDYRRQSDLTIPAQPTRNPELPPADREHTGRAQLTLLIGEDGRVDAVLAGESTVSADYLNQLRLAFLDMEFEPGYVEGRVARARLVIEVTLTPVPEIIDAMTESGNDAS